jgi:two-component system chemotaxis response regulator CheY
VDLRERGVLLDPPLSSPYIIGSFWREVASVMNILIIDDSMVMRRIHRNTLLEHGVSEDGLFEAADGNAALKMAGQMEIDLFLVDWNMPKLDGFQLVKALRSIPRYMKTPIIMITSEAAKYNVVEAINAGVTNYVVKPIQGDTLWQKLAPYFKKSAGSGA